MTSTGEEAPVASIVSDVTAGARRLLRQEVDLARTEIRAEALKAVRAARLVAWGAGALWLVMTLASIGAVLALSEVFTSSVPELARWSTAIVTVAVALFWLIVGLALGRSGRRRLRRLSPIPRQTIASLKEDIAWLRNPNA
jgi:hypothetical protein